MVSNVEFQEPPMQQQPVQMEMQNQPQQFPNQDGFNNVTTDPNNPMNNVGMAMGMNFDVNMMVQPNQFQPTWTVSNGVTHLNLTTVGQKTQQRNACVQFLTCFFGIFFIFPLFFTCCMWWKKIVYPKYEVNEEFYRAFVRFCRRSNFCTTINLTVADNAFNAEKANILYEGLSSSTATTFNFINMALACNHRQNEADNFLTNVAPLKDLTRITTSLTWGDMSM